MWLALGKMNSMNYAINFICIVWKHYLRNCFMFLMKCLLHYASIKIRKYCNLLLRYKFIVHHFHKYAMCTHRQPFWSSICSHLMYSFRQRDKECIDWWTNSNSKELKVLLHMPSLSPSPSQPLSNLHWRTGWVPNRICLSNGASPLTQC